MAKKKWPQDYQDLTPGCMVFEPASARAYHTGAWRAQKPTYTFSRCIKCGLCYLYCPEGCIHETEEGYFVADLDYCKGCGICAHECWPRAITMVDEED